jgi:hypothetical protein
VLNTRNARIPHSWIRYEDDSSRSDAVIKAYEEKYDVKVGRVFCIGAFREKDKEIYHAKDADFYFPDENKELMRKKPAMIYCFILKNN